MSKPVLHPTESAWMADADADRAVQIESAAYWQFNLSIDEQLDRLIERWAPKSRRPAADPPMSGDGATADGSTPYFFSIDAAALEALRLDILPLEARPAEEPPVDESPTAWDDPPDDLGELDF